jgi:hypothetical protein
LSTSLFHHGDGAGNGDDVAVFGKTRWRRRRGGFGGSLDVGPGATEGAEVVEIAHHEGDGRLRHLLRRSPASVPTDVKEAVTISDKIGSANPIVTPPLPLLAHRPQLGRRQTRAKRLLSFRLLWWRRGGGSRGADSFLGSFPSHADGSEHMSWRDWTPKSRGGADIVLVAEVLAVCREMDYPIRVGHVPLQLVTREQPRWDLADRSKRRSIYRRHSSHLVVSLH